MSRNRIYRGEEEKYAVVAKTRDTPSVKMNALGFDHSGSMGELITPFPRLRGLLP